MSPKDIARTMLSLGLPSAVLDRAAGLRGTQYFARAAIKAHMGSARPFQMVNVGACDGMLFDDATPWLHRIKGSKAVLVEPIPFNQKRLRQNYRDTIRFVIEPVAVTYKPGTITVKTFEEAAILSGTLPIEFVGCSSVAETNLMSGADAWGESDANFNKYAPYLKEIEVKSDTLQSVLDRNDVAYIDAFLVDCEGADWVVFDQLDLQRYRPGMIKVEIGALTPVDIGHVIVKLKTAGYSVGLHNEDVWGFAL
jgi:FkbM family methyltransferase